ncbi:hypothetical protein P3389_34185, partial [Vibrio parahaemolyticus]|nr:hypothetical protein [Vibrio parahaemolyticus]
MADGQSLETSEKQPSKRIQVPLCEEAKKSKKKSDQRTGKTRVNLSQASKRWRELRDQRGFKTDVQLAFFR